MKRYRVKEIMHIVEESKDGDWVKYSDVEALEKENKELQEKIKISDIINERLREEYRTLKGIK